MITQSRIHSLQPYVQKDVGEEGYIAPSELQIVVDHPSFERSMKLSLTGGEAGVSIHQEKGRLSTPESHSFTIPFDVAFTAKPIGFHKAYRIETSGTDERYFDVLVKSEKVLTTGIALVLDSSENLTGVIVEWFYT